MSLNDKREPENPYQSLQTPNIHPAEFENHPAFISIRQKLAK
jgi:hypothetical protein